MDANGVAVGIEDQRHPAHRCLQRLDAEFHVVLFQMRDGGVEVVDFERGAATVGTGFEAGRAAERHSVGTEFVFGPLAMVGVGDGCRFQIQDAFVEIAGAFHVGDSVTAKCQFNDFHNLMDAKAR